MQYRFVKTPAGQAEIQARALHLARPVRNLLLILHPGQPASHWLAQVQGCTPDDLVQLESAGLITRSAAPAAAAAPRHPDDVFAALQQRVRATGYAPLYEALNAFGKDTLGLLRGYRFALEVDHCRPWHCACWSACARTRTPPPCTISPSCWRRAEAPGERPPWGTLRPCLFVCTCPSPCTRGLP